MNKKIIDDSYRFANQHMQALLWLASHPDIQIRPSHWATLHYSLYHYYETRGTRKLKDHEKAALMHLHKVEFYPSKVFTDILLNDTNFLEALAKYNYLMPKKGDEND